MFCEHCGNKLIDNSKFCGKCGKENKIEKTKIQDYDFLYIPISRLIWASILSFGIYTIYWFSANWTAIKKVTGEKIEPFWRGVFSIFFSNKPFSLALKQAKDLGYNDDYNVNVMVAFYVIAVIGNRIVDKIPDTSLAFDLFWIVMGTMLIIYPLIQVQKVINWSNNKKRKVFKKVGLPEFGLIGLGWGIAILFVFANM